MAKKSAGDGVTKAAALRKSLETNGWNVDLGVHQDYLKSTHGIEMRRDQISQYISAERRRQGKPRRRRRKGAAGAEGQAASTESRSDAVLQLINTVRGWEEKLGSKKVLNLIDVICAKK